MTRALAGLLREQAARGGSVELVTRRASWPDPGHVVDRVHPYAALPVRDNLGRQQVRSEIDDAWYLSLIHL